MLKKISFFICILLISVCFIFPVNAVPKVVTMPVEYNTTDGMIMKGTLYIPKTQEKPSVVVLLHSLGGSQRDWGDLVTLLNNKNFAVMTLDLRGHGQSIYNRKMQRKYWQNFNNDIFKKYPSDVGLGIDNLRNYKQINSSDIAVVGMGTGATVGALVSSSHKNAVKTLVLISPAEDFRGMNILLKIVDYGDHPIFAIAGENDRMSVSAVNKIKKVAQSEFKEVIYPKSGSGILLYKNKPQIKTEIINWLGEKL